MADKKTWKTTDDKVTTLRGEGTTKAIITADDAPVNYPMVMPDVVSECKCAEKDTEIARLTHRLDMQSTKSDLEPLKKEIGGTASGHVFKIASAKVLIAIAERLDGIDKSLALIAAKK